MSNGNSDAMRRRWDLLRMQSGQYTTEALLFNSAVGRVTRHEFVGTEPCEFLNEQRSAKPRQPATALMYRCLETGTLRRWGVE